MSGHRPTTGIMPKEGDLLPAQKAFHAPDTVVLPIQLVPARWTAEQEMLSEMLICAVKDARTEEIDGIPEKRTYQRFLIQRRALGWIFSQGMEPFSFEWVCEHARQDAVKIRKRLRAEMSLAGEIEAHLLDPKNVPPPYIPEEYRWRAIPGGRGRPPLDP